MKFKSIVLGVIIFVLIGELILRIDQDITPFAQDEHVFLPVKVSESAELKMAKANKVPLDDSTFRVMVLGDSYINGFGTDENQSFANLLRSKLLKDTKQRYKRFLVLDISQPGNNSLDNYHVFHHYNDSFKPQIVILPYNINDVEDNLDEVNILQAARNKAVNHVEKPNLAKRIYSVIYQVHLVQFILHNLHLYLKGMGIVIPNSELDLQIKAYTQNQETWVKSKVILNKMINEISAKNQKLVVILMPEYNLLNNLNAFYPAYNVVGKFFSNKPNVTFINPVKYFKKFPLSELRVSKYDGHPSIKAHDILSDSINVYFNKLYLK